MPQVGKGIDVARPIRAPRETAPHAADARCGFTNTATLCRLVKKETGRTMGDLRGGFADA